MFDWPSRSGMRYWLNGEPQKLSKLFLSDDSTWHEGWERNFAVECSNCLLPKFDNIKIWGGFWLYCQHQKGKFLFFVNCQHSASETSTEHFLSAMARTENSLKAVWSMAKTRRVPCGSIRATSSSHAAWRWSLSREVRDKRTSRRYLSGLD